MRRRIAPVRSRRRTRRAGARARPRFSPGRTAPPPPPCRRGGADKRTTVATLLGLDPISAVRDRSFWVSTARSLLLMLSLDFHYDYANPF